jgi:hypothetical protein
MEVVVEVHDHGANTPPLRRVFSFPASPRKGDRVQIEGFGAALLLEVAEVWWREGDPPLITLTGSVTIPCELPTGWTPVVSDE